MRLDDGKELSLRAVCVLQTPRVELIRAECVGTCGGLIDADEEQGVYTIEVAGAAPMLLPREAVVLPAGTWVQLAGLAQKPELNGQCGAVVSFDRTSGRYEVNTGTSKVRIKPANIRLQEKALCPE